MGWLMKTGFIIVNYNSWNMTEKLAQKAASFTHIDAVVVVDNASTDDSFWRLKQLNHRKIHVFQTSENGGYSRGNNYGAHICRDMGMEIVFMANPDTDVEETHIQKIRDHFAADGYSVLSGVEYDIYGNMRQPPLWKRKEYWDDVGDCFFLWRTFSRKNFGTALDKNTEVQPAEMVKGSFFAVRLEDFLDAGGFDEQIFLYCEERVLSKKMEDSGRKMGIVTDARYVHTQTASIQKTYKKVSRRIQILYQSRLYYHRKYSRIGILKYILLAAAMKLSVLEYQIRDMIQLLSPDGLQSC